MTYEHWLLLFGAGFLAGAMNAIAGGGSFILYPILLSLGVAPVSANATSSLLVFPGQLSSALGYRKYIKRVPKYYLLLLIPCMIGGFVGAFLLAQTPDATFERIVPWFIIAAATLLALQPRIHTWIYSRKNRALRKKYASLIDVVVALALLLVSIYGGYFGAGFGIMMLAFLGLTKLSNINEMNGIKNIIGVFLTGMVSIYFIVNGLMAWWVVPFAFTGNIAGGWFGATYSERLPTRLVRIIIIIIAFALAGALFVRAYHLH
jgi:uncharacterized membrane protein YfcA